MRIFGIPKREEQTVCRAAMEGTSPSWKISFQMSGKLGQYELKKHSFYSNDNTHFKHANASHQVGRYEAPQHCELTSF